MAHSKPMCMGKMYQRVLWRTPRRHIVFTYPLLDTVFYDD
jgi:hypothetical protein